MKYSLSQKSLFSSSNISAGMPNQLVKRIGMALFFATSLGLSACGDKDAATQTASTTNDEPVAASTEVAEAPTPEVATEQADANSAEQEPASDADATATDNTEADSAASSDTADTAPDTAAAPEPELAAGAGKELYESHCKQCHEGGLLGAPKFGDKAAWASRIEQGKDALYIHSAKGYKKMPAQATGDVSVAQVHAAVDYMVEHSS